MNTKVRSCPACGGTGVVPNSMAAAAADERWNNTRDVTSLMPIERACWVCKGRTIVEWLDDKKCVPWPHE